jgi:hypothetical protein
VFKVAREKLSAVVDGVQLQGQRMITPPRSLPDTAAIPETPKHNGDTATTPNSSTERNGKRAFQQSPTENVRRSPRNHRSSFDANAFPAVAVRPIAIAPKPVPIAPQTPVHIAPKPVHIAPKPKIPHPFFLGKEARISTTC